MIYLTFHLNSNWKIVHKQFDLPNKWHMFQISSKFPKVLHTIVYKVTDNNSFFAAERTNPSKLNQSWEMTVLRKSFGRNGSWEKKVSLRPNTAICRKPGYGSWTMRNVMIKWHWNLSDKCFVRINWFVINATDKKEKFTQILSTLIIFVHVICLPNFFQPRVLLRDTDFTANKPHSLHVRVWT